MSVQSVIDHKQVNTYTVDVRVIKPVFSIGDIVEVRLRQGGKWYLAEVRRSYCHIDISIDKDGIEVFAYHWEHYCNVIDDRVATDSCVVYETGAGISDTIRYPEDE